MLLGLGNRRIPGPERLIDGLSAQGFRVIRYDNRDIGESTHLHATPAPHPLLYLAGAKIGLRPRIAYELSDMADDAVALQYRRHARRVERGLGASRTGRSCSSRNSHVATSPSFARKSGRSPSGTPLRRTA